MLIYSQYQKRNVKDGPDGLLHMVSIGAVQIRISELKLHLMQTTGAVIN
ncbi:hypothetical protein MT997_06200 [Paenibacillus sp. OVF10]|nr:hypothetical protein MT997_06200 [Paenibacillus sp. OVF10]